VLVGLDRIELRWFQARMERFGEDHRARIAVRAWSDRADLLRLLARDRATGHPRILLADVPFDRMMTLVDSSAILPLAGALGTGRAADLLAPFEPAALAPGKFGGRAYFMPSRLSTLCLYYSKAHVADACAHWQAMRPQIERWLSDANGAGLPNEYVLEADPELWDSYDVFVAAAYWASLDVSGMKVARVAHVIAPEEALALDLASRTDALGGGNTELLDANGDRLADALAWEAMFFRHGLYHPAMMKERWTAFDVEGAVAQGQVWMALLEPRDILRLRGLPGQDGFVKDAADLGVASNPRGASLLAMQHYPAHTGDSWAARTGYGWGVPAACPDPKFAGALLQFLAGDETTADAATTLGWLPPRRGIRDEVETLYRDRKSQDIARVAAQQLFERGRALPESPRWAEAQPALVRLWEQAAVRDQLTTPRALVEAMRQAAGPPAAPPAR
jgi:ABC-type glycerol-3-phosphate transport system substrate-binding protein